MEIAKSTEGMPEMTVRDYVWVLWGGYENFLHVPKA